MTFRNGTDCSVAENKRETSSFVDRDNPEESQKLLEVAESTPDVLWLFSADWKEVLYVTSAWEDLFGCSVTTFADNPTMFIERAHPADREPLEQWMERVSTGQADTLKYRVCSSENELRWVKTRAEPVTDDSGTVQRIAGFTRDITEQKERYQHRKRERYRLRQTERIGQIGSWELTPQDIVRATDGAQRLHGLNHKTPAPLEDILELYRPQDRAKLREAIGQCRESGDPVNLEVQLVTARGRTRWLTLKGQREPSDEVGRIFGTVQDITQQKEREQRLMVLTRALRHDLRNKLSIVNGFTEQVAADFAALEAERNELAELIENDTTVPDGRSPTESTPETQVRQREQNPAPHNAEIRDERVQKNVRRILDATEYLASMGEKSREFKEVTNVSGGRELTAVRPVLARLKRQYIKDTSEVTIEINGSDAKVSVNRDLLRLAVREVIENAIEHRERDNVVISIDVLEPTTTQTSIRVADDGPGIPAMERETLENGKESSLTHSNGLGLWIVDLLMKRCGGQLSIEDNEPTGTVVTLSFPTPE